jgi:hypothetical protein
MKRVAKCFWDFMSYPGGGFSMLIGLALYLLLVWDSHPRPY